MAAKARTLAEGHKEVILITVDFDTSRWVIDSPFVAVAGELVRVLADRGVDAALSTLLLTLHTLQVLPRGEGSSGGAQEWGLELLDKGVEFSQGLPGVGALLKFGRWMYNRAQRQEAEFTVRDLGLWPVESGGRVDLQDLERKIGLAVFEDLRALSGETPRTSPQSHC